MIESEQGSRAAAGSRDRRHVVQSLKDVLEAFVGKVVVVSNPESLRPAPLGHQIRPHVHKARISSVHDELLIVVTQESEGNDNGERFPTKQFIPFRWIKLVCFSKEELHIHV
jgi:hypothetical protein